MVGKKISFITKKRNKAKNDFEKDLYKLLNKLSMEKRWNMCQTFCD